jgi:hypothetical protein
MVCLALSGCMDADTPQARLEQLLAQAVLAAEQRDTGAFMDLVAEDYSDARGQDRAQLRNYLRGLFLRFGTIHVDYQLLDATGLTDTGGEVRLELRFSGPGGDRNPLWAMGAQAYPLRLDLVASPGGPYQVLRASWSESGG